MPKKSSRTKKGRKGSIAKSATTSLAKVAGTVRESLPNKLPIEEVRKQLLSYASQIENYLGKVDAKVENFKFSVEISDKGLMIDAAFKATIST